MQKKLVRFVYERRAIPKRIISVLVPKPVLLNLGNFKMYVRLDDWAIGARIAVKRSYQQHVTRVIQSYLKPGGVVVDVGANIGYYTLLSAATVGPAGKVIAFEPGAANCALLKMSLQKNNFSNVSLHGKAVAAANGYLGFGMDDSNGIVSQTTDASHPTRVEAVTLDTFLQDEPRIDVMKVDVEGAEGLALRGMTQLLRRHRPVMFTEFSPEALPVTSGMSPEGYLDGLRDVGYALYVIPDSGSASPAPQTNREIMAAYAASKSDHLDLRAVPEAQAAGLTGG